MKVISWNVNGLRAILRRGLLDYLAREDPDVLCLQETRAGANDVEQLWPAAFTTFWNAGCRKGYSGTMVFTRTRPIGTACGIGLAEHDGEGRVLTLEFPDFHVVNVYVPNSKRDLSRLPYRVTWDRALLQYLRKLGRRKPLVVCGDFNVAHQPIDLANPGPNVGNHGFTPEERGGFDALLRAGWVDTFREFEKDGGHYTWWSPITGARARNVGWRLDYVLVSDVLRSRLKSAFIRSEVPGSDHCPVGIELE